MINPEKNRKQMERLIEMSQYESALYSIGRSFIAGVDEVGRGPLAGPVVAAAVILPQNFSVLGIDDSKKLSSKQRSYFFEIIKSEAICWSIGIRDHDDIDRINILNATKEAMGEAIQNLNVQPDHVLIDAVRLPDLKMSQTNIIRGDSSSVSIAAASILAKVIRDNMMIEYAKIFPGYSFESNKGYGTKSHYEGLDAYGPCSLHRRTFLSNYFAKGNIRK
ncbi:MAG: ribonuclease HII [Clostridia bacterium]|nr:ribonuclease HII [Clostridia bacterium]